MIQNFFYLKKQQPWFLLILQSLLIGELIYIPDEGTVTLSEKDVKCLLFFLSAVGHSRSRSLQIAIKLLGSFHLSVPISI
jgi:hypothetical protein